MKTSSVSVVVAVMLPFFLVFGCTTLGEMGSPKAGEVLSNRFPTSKISQNELFDLALQELKDEGINIENSKQEDGIILGTLDPSGIGRADGASAVTLVRKLASALLLVRVDVTKPDSGESNVSINVKKSKSLLPGDPYAIQRHFIDNYKTRVGKYLEAKAAEPTKRIIDPIDQPPAALLPQKLKRNGYAVLIGVESYRDLPKVDFAQRDVETVRDYLIQVGYPEENIILRTNERASRSDFESYLEQWLQRNVEKESDVFIYYSGHGSPHPKSGQPFLVPYDGDPAFLDSTAYSVERMYKALAKLPTDRIVVVLDSCFSGSGGRSVVAKGSRPVGLAIELPTSDVKNLVVFSASQNNQISFGFPEKRHGLFTYFFLKAFHGDADADQDGIVSIGELQEYVRVQVQLQSRRMNAAEQTPQLTTAENVRSEMLKFSLFNLP